MEKEEKKVAPKKEEKTKKETVKEESAPKEKAQKGLKEAVKEKLAPKKEEKKERKIVRETVHMIPLKKAWRAPRTKRTRAAAKSIKEYIVKHTRKKPVLSPELNAALWKQGIQNPPRRIKAKIVEEEDKATAEVV